MKQKLLGLLQSLPKGYYMISGGDFSYLSNSGNKIFIKYTFLGYKSIILWLNALIAFGREYIISDYRSNWEFISTIQGRFLFPIKWYHGFSSKIEYEVFDKSKDQTTYYNPYDLY